VHVTLGGFVDGFQPYKSNNLHTMVAFMVAPLTVRTEDRWVRGVAHTVGLVPGSNSAELRVSELPFFQALIQEMLFTANEGIQVILRVQLPVLVSAQYVSRSVCRLRKHPNRNKRVFRQHRPVVL
jgi:hypothetical protein